MKKRKEIMFCPKCRSLDVKKEITIKVAAFGAPSQWKCNNCKFRGYLFPKAIKNFGKK